MNNTYNRMLTLVVNEGKSTGGDVEATAERLGKWVKSIKPNARPGTEGYLRKRNVPRTTDTYDPTKHTAPEEGKPLKYMKPQHKDYAINKVNTIVPTVAARVATASTSNIGNIHRRDKAKKEIFNTEKEKGKAILKKHRVPNPSIPEMAVKWTKGNSPKSKNNPEGYIRSDGN
jgi:hypothetical protein